MFYTYHFFIDIPFQTYSSSDLPCKVAIQNVSTGRYLSCRRKYISRTSALVEYRRNIGEFETFIVTQASDNTYVFQTHNGLYLAVNETYYSSEFLVCSSRDEHGIPLMGRWEILDTNERIGEHNTTVIVFNTFLLIENID